MATVILQAAGAALGSAFGPLGAAAGRALGALAGSAIDNALFGAGGAGPAHLPTARIPGPEEGTPIPRVYGTVRIGGTLIWATRFLEEAVEERDGAKGSGRSGETRFTYSVSLALSLCEGPIAGVRRVFADGRELSLDGIEMRVYRGTAGQQPDPLILARQGAGKAPAYRGLAYVVFENLPLGPFGDRIPVLQFEVIRPVGALERQVRAVTLIPGATEHGYDPQTVTESMGGGSSRRLNRNTLSGQSDWTTSLDELQALCPALETVALTVSWFGTSLDLGECAVVPGVEVPVRSGESRSWTVSGLTRSGARLISTAGGGPAYGGTPSDASVIAAIRDLRRRGLKVVLYPFLLMDIPAGNTLSDPYGAARQAAYPWRGRITCRPAPGLRGSPDRTGAIPGLVARFAGTAAPEDFTPGETTVAFRGEGFGFRRMILHYAHLARLAGGVDGFLLSSELRGLTTLRDGENRFPFVAELVKLSREVAAILGSRTKITYGADWSEYFGHQPADGSGDVFFHLDPLWAAPDIHAVGIDNYLPLSDFRDGDLASAHPDGFSHAEDPAALRAGIVSGERFDWYYASEADRAARRRTPITDGAAGKPWVFAPKDIAGWWSNRHYERRGGRELATPTAWMPRMKPVWFTELGAPAIDRGANEPNLFSDPKSAESSLPAFSRGHRADSAQRRFLEAHYRHWTGGQAPAGMVSPADIFLWCWDTRPYPVFPHGSVWSDGGNWRTGHWLNGRLGAGTLADTIAAILRDHGMADADVSGVSGDLPGYVQADIVPARALLEPLVAAFGLDVLEEGGRLVFRSRAEASLPAIPLPVLAERPGEPLFSELRGEASAVPEGTLLSFSDQAADHEPARARAASLSGGGTRLADIALPAALDAGLAERLAAAHLRDLGGARRVVRFRLPSSALAVEPGDVVTLPGLSGRFLVTRIDEERERLVEARSFAPAPGGVRALPPPVPKAPRLPPGTGFSPEIVFLDLPRMGSGETAGVIRVAGLMRPWRPLILSTTQGDGSAARLTLDRPATIGRLAEALAPAGIYGRFDGKRTILVDFGFGAPSSASRAAALAGENRIAIRQPDGTAEIVGFRNAEEIAPGRFRLSGLLNGLDGTDEAGRRGAAAGAVAVLIGPAVKSLPLGEAERGRMLAYRVTGTGALGGTAGPFAFAGGLGAERPLAPAHFRAERTPSGDLLFRWVRRGRIDADDWEASDIPLDQETERYRLDILKGGSVVRRFTPGEPRCLYSALQQQADGLGPGDPLEAELRQIGRRVPEGVARRIPLPA
ncbi:baseplate multidomain protein megatron [Gellertiella hungarica]|uniref:Phage tail protein n=1 Tax=Gellertiella hungarica TaxID=1572859 RepID=A0A7W6J886_9HYPH|nr:glycoside hydrolase/phage tail family protein [Gellertiella hungarica]MBB4065718.1 hypothetical protein [Gellertiella hungarica]